MRKSLCAAALAMVSFAVGCSSGDDGPNPDSETDMPAAGRCDSVEGVDSYSAGMSKTGDNGVSIAIDEAEPAPPAQYDNTWMLTVTDSTGAPISDAQVTVEPFMPEHGHGSNRTPIITDMGDGTFQAERVNLMMPGFWEVTVKVVSATLTDQVKFSFCIS